MAYWCVWGIEVMGIFVCVVVYHLLSNCIYITVAMVTAMD